MEAIASGKGRKPKPFVLRGGKVEADAVWDSRTGLAADERKQKARGTKKPATGSAADMPDFIAPQLCETLARPPSAKGWIHEIKFDGYRVQVHLANEAVKIFIRRGHDWTHRFKTSEGCGTISDGLTIRLKL
jgi:bifunctional non-homologous end joining protein LigD